MFNSEIKRQIEHIKGRINAMNEIRRDEEDEIVRRVTDRMMSNERFIWAVIQRIKEFQLNEKK